MFIFHFRTYVVQLIIIMNCINSFLLELKLCWIMGGVSESGTDSRLGVGGADLGSVSKLFMQKK